MKKGQAYATQRFRRNAMLTKAKQYEKQLTEQGNVMNIVRDIEKQVRLSIVDHGTIKNSNYEVVYAAIADMPWTEEVGILVRFILNGQEIKFEKRIKVDPFLRRPEFRNFCRNHAELVVADYIANRMRTDVAEIFFNPKSRDENGRIAVYDNLKMHR